MLRCANSDSARVSAFSLESHKSPMWTANPTTDCERGALLLLDFKNIAADELQYTKIEIPSIPPKVRPRIEALIPSQWEDSESDSRGKPDLSPKKRPRTVSVSFDDPPMSPLQTSPSNSYDSESSMRGSPASLTCDYSSVQVTPDRRKIVIRLPDTLKQADSILGRPSPSKLVGTEVKGPVKAILQRKFSWKNYPALEDYLVRNRAEYLQYSSELNYTAEQKRYNNTLTQGLLDLAEKEGYLFEDFTFAAIRDRIRCYYKSYVQATKKKKKRKRGNSF